MRDSNVLVEVRVVDFSERNEDGEPLQVTHRQEFTRDTLSRQDPRQFAETVVGLGAEAVFRRFVDEATRPEDPLSSFYPRLKFAHGPAENVVYSGVNATVRYELDLDLSEGDIVEFVHADYGTAFARARVVALETLQASDVLGWIDRQDGRYEANTLDELLTSLNGYYSDPIEWDTDLTAIRFDVIEEFPGQEEAV